MKKYFGYFHTISFLFLFWKKRKARKVELEIEGHAQMHLKGNDIRTLQQMDGHPCGINLTKLNKSTYSTNVKLKDCSFEDLKNEKTGRV